MQWTIFSFQIQTLVLFSKICYCSIKLQFLFVGDKGVKQLFLSPQTRTLHMLFTHCSQFFWDTLNFSGLFFTSFSFSFFLSLTLHTIQQANSALHFLTPLLCFQFNPFSLLFLLFHCLACPFFHYCPSFPQAFFCLFRPLSLALYLFENLCGPEGELGSKSL